jgi:dihydropteroate synthase
MSAADPLDPLPSPSPRSGSFSAPAWDLGPRVLTPPGRPLVMGILNVTVDSFYAASRHIDPESVGRAAAAMAAAGADLLDLGAESSRPGADPVDPARELACLLPALAAVRERTDLPVSIDTVRAATARAALAAGADAVNDISAARHDPEMLATVAAAGRGLVLMHMQGTPRTMQAAPRYDDVVAEVAAFLAARAAAAVAAGIPAARVLVDPGIGFGKSEAHNFSLLAALRAVAGRHGLLLGASRKSFLRSLRGPAPEDRLGGSLAALAAAQANHATVVRVHDVAASVQFLDTLAAIESAQPEVERTRGA